MKHIFAALPNLGWIATPLMVNLIPWLKAGIYLFPMENVRPNAFAYNSCIDEFLKSDRTHLWFLNADTIPPVDALKLLDDADKDIICGVTPTIVEYTSEGPLSALMVCRRNEDGELKTITGRGITWIDCCGTACTMIKREVVEKMACPWFEDKNWHGQTAGDFGFCDKAKELGFEIWAHFDVRCTHRKEVDL